MKTVTTEHGKSTGRRWRQSRVTLTQEEWKEYRQLLVRGQASGGVAGWTRIDGNEGHVVVLVTYRAEDSRNG